MDSDAERPVVRLHRILEPAAEGDRCSRAMDVLLVLLAASSVLAATLWSVDSLASRFGTWFQGFEIFAASVFGAEYIARLLTAGQALSVSPSRPFRARLDYVLSLQGLVDLLAFAPCLLALAFGAEPHLAHVLPLLRVLKLMRYSPALETLAVVLYTERRPLTASVIIMIVLLLMSSSIIYLVEREAQPTVFNSIPNAMWWGIATLTTVGYGDVTPVTPLGKFFGSLVTVLGIAMFALPAGILATGFAQEIKQRGFLVTWNLVAGVPFFSRLDAGEIARIARLLVPQVVQAGQVVVRKGDAADCMYFIVSGELQVQLDNRTVKLEDSFFGEIALLSRSTRMATVTATTRAQLLVLHAKHLEAFLGSQPGLAEAIQKVASERLAEFNDPSR